MNANNYKQQSFLSSLVDRIEHFEDFLFGCDIKDKNYYKVKEMLELSKGIKVKIDELMELELEKEDK